MKNRLLAFVFLFLIIASQTGYAQVNLIYTYAGNLGAGYAGDGGPATNAKLYQPFGIAIDKLGNIFVADVINQRIRKISNTGIITTIAGTGTTGYTGDGGPATAAKLNWPCGVAADGIGNVYIADRSNNCIRKVDTAGIITTVPVWGLVLPYAVTVDKYNTLFIANSYGNKIVKMDTFGVISGVAGIGSAGFGGDGGPATDALLNVPDGIAVDDSGNVYIGDTYNYRVRKINTAGVITTIAGTGVSGFGGDGGPATAAKFNHPEGIAFDTLGNIYISDRENGRVRKIDDQGIITTFAGGGGMSGDGVPAFSASIYANDDLVSDNAGNLYISCAVTHSVKKIISTPSHIYDSFLVNVNGYCGGVGITLVPNHYATGMAVKTFFGDGTVDSSVFHHRYGLTVNHHYVNSGAYTIKQTLYLGPIVLQSVKYTYVSRNCNCFQVNCYLDNNSNCLDDAGDYPIFPPMAFEVDSSGIAIDTIPSTSGFYYNAYGNIGEVYKFRSIATPAGLVPRCPVSATYSGTLQENGVTNIGHLGFSCSPVAGFDLQVFPSFGVGHHYFGGNIIIDNRYCTPQPATLTMQLNPKYNTWIRPYPTPTSVVGNAVTWDFSGISLVQAKHLLIYAGAERSPAYSPAYGDTVATLFSITPVSGDANTADNIVIRNDTVSASFDPNYMEVSPGGCTFPGNNKLRYTIHFENTGNDTAFNIAVLDTLSNDIDPKSIRIVAASADMNTSVTHYGGYNIVKFDFPDINLLDSSHYGECDGMVIFDVNMKSGIADGTTILNRAGIYFDYNPVVMTNTVGNSVGCAVYVPQVQQLRDVEVYPNPASNSLHVDNMATPANYSLQNIVGVMVQEGALRPGRNAIDITALPKGIYVLTLTDEQDNKVVRKVVKE